MNDLTRFLEAQNQLYDTALTEIKRGRKQTHWMWFIFPQLKGLGSSPTAQFYGMATIDQAAAYLAHPVLSARLVEITHALLDVQGKSATEIMGSPDDAKLHSCMTLFDAVAPDSVFRSVIDRYFNGIPDARTMAMLRNA